MRDPHFRLRCGLAVAATLALGLAAGCTSKDTVAANKAAEAQIDLDQGRLVDAQRAIGRAIAARDDIADYWLLKAHIDLRAANLQGAYSDYEFAVQLDHANTEALQGLCQLGPSVGNPDSVDRYADQLLTLTPNAAAALIAKGSLAQSRNDSDKAQGFADRVLAQDAQSIPALTLKARILIARSQFADAAALIEKTTTRPDNMLDKLKLLKAVYTEAKDHTAYEQTVRRMAAAAPDNADVQLDYADLLYQDGQLEQARGVMNQVMASNPTDFRIAAAALNELLRAGPQALDTGRMVADGARLSLLMKADYAQFAIETGHPDIAIALLRGADQGDPTPENSNAKAALAYAMGITGHMPQAIARLNDILGDDHDPGQPWALLARARLLAASHDYLDAVRDARLLVANDPGNASAHLALADILQASGSADLSLSALREGLRAIPGSTRMAARLAATLSAQGSKDQAAQVARDLVRAAAMDQRAQHLLQTYAPATVADAQTGPAAIRHI